MHDLAPLSPGAPTFERFSTQLPGQLLSGFVALHVKVVSAKEPGLVDTFGFPGPLSVAQVDQVEALWIGPGEWLMLATSQHIAALGALEGQLAECGIGGVRCDSRLAIFELKATAELVSSLTGLPVSAIAPGRVARTRFADLPVTIASADDEVIRIFFDRTCTSHLFAALDHAI